MNIRCLLLVPLVLGFSSIRATAEPQRISVRTMALSPGAIPELFFAASAEKPEPLTPVNWPTSQPSRYTVTTLQEGFLVLYSLVAAEDGKQVPQVTHRVKLPENVKEILLFGLINEDKLKFHAISDKFLDAKFDDWLLINFSGKEIAFKVGNETKPISLKSTESKIYKIAVREGEGANVKGLANIQGEARPFYSTYLPVQKLRRTIVIFADDGEKIRTKLITDHFSLKEAEK